MAVLYYNEVQLGTAVGKFSFSQTYKEVNIGTQIIVKGTSAANLITNCKAIEDACALKNKKIVLSFGGETEYTFDPSTTTGFKARVSLDKARSDADLNLSREYNVKISATIPYATNDYRQDATFTITFHANRQWVANFTLVYTDGGGNTALQNYSSYGKAWASGILATFGGSYEIIEEQLSQDDELNTITAKLTYKEIISKQSSGGTNLGSIVGSSCTYEVNFKQLQGVGTTSGIKNTVPLATVTLNYSTTVSCESILSDSSIESVYRSTVKPWLVQQVKNVLGLSNYKTSNKNNLIIINDKMSINPDTYTISGIMEIAAPSGINDIFILSEALSYREDMNIVFAKLWDGKDYTYNTYSTGKDLYCTRTINIVKYGEYFDIARIEEIKSSDAVWLMNERRWSQRQEQFNNENNVVGAIKTKVSFQNIIETYTYVKPVEYKPVIEYQVIESPPLSQN